MNKKSWVVYILRCSNGALYTGITNNVEKRLAAHNAGRGAKYTRSFRPVEVVWLERKRSASFARKREAEIKSWTKQKKETLCRLNHPLEPARRNTATDQNKR